MLFICSQIDGIPFEELILNLYGVSEAPRDYLTDIDGNQLAKLLTLTGYKNGAKDKISVQFGRETLAAYFQSRVYAPYTEQTIAQLATAAGVTIDMNFTDSASYRFLFRSFLDPAAPFQSSYWWTVFTDAGLYLAIPVRRSDAVEIKKFDPVSTVERSGFFDGADYVGESGADFLIASDCSQVVPVSVNSVQKTRVLNKYYSQDTVLKFRTGAQKVRPCDYVTYGGKTFVILSKKNAGNGLYEYVAVLEMDDTYTFGVTDNNYNVRPYAYVPEIVDQWHYVGAAGEPSFAYSWVNYNASAGGNMKLRFKRTPGGFLKVEGMIKSGTSNQVFTLPSGYRPANPLSSEMEGVALHYDGTTQKPGRVFITSNGNFYVTQVQGTYWVAINLSFGLD